MVISLIFAELLLKNFFPQNLVVWGERDLFAQYDSNLGWKNKASFTPHVDCGDNVIVITAEKVVLTGKKMTDKVYLRHTGYPGGQRKQSPEDILAKYPGRLVEKAVRGMLPKNRLGRKLFKNLHVVIGAEHKFEAQKPKVVDLNTIK